jgi:PAS domain S-box-containing protein
MSHDTWPDGSFADLADLAGRRDALRLAAADPRTLLDAAFAELDAAIETLAKLAAAGEDDGTAAAARGADEDLLRAVFEQAPAPLIMLDPDGTIRQANTRAGDLIGVSPTYAAGKPLSSFADLASRAAVQSQLAAAIRTGAAQTGCTLVGRDGPVAVTLSVSALPAGTRLLVVTMTPEVPGRPAPPAPSPPPDYAAMARRMDMVTAATRLLLDNSTFSEAVTLQRCARLLAGEIASWVIVDVERSGELRRQFVVGPPGEREDELARDMRGADPPAESVPAQVHATGQSVILAHADDAGVLGSAPDGLPLLLALGATSLVSVPISDGDSRYGVLTLTRQAAEGRFTLADLALAGELGQHLGVAIRVDRMFRHRSAVAEALQGSLLPVSLPEVPGLELSAAYIPASEGLEVSGDFYDVFQVEGGWAITVGDVCGKGQEAAAMTAAARHAIRAIAHWNPDPVDVLARVNEVILAGGYEDRFVTVKLAYLRTDGDRVRAELASSGHPGPAVVRPDGRVDVISGGGLPLGLFPDAEPDRDSLELGQDDLLFFYSDGVTEARSPDMQYFEDRLADELAGAAGRSAAETTRMIQRLVTRFSRDDLRDDMTILVARVRGGNGES